jgi:hypothetical protein
MNKKQLAMGLFALGASAIPLTDKMIKEAGNQEGASITSKAYVITGIYTNNYDLQAGGTFIGAAGGIGLAVGLLCGIQAAVTLAVGA